MARPDGASRRERSDRWQHQRNGAEMRDATEALAPSTRTMRASVDPAQAAPQLGGHGVEHGLDVGRRATDDAQDLARRGLLLEGLGDLCMGIRKGAVLLLKLREQTRRSRWR